VKIKSTYQFLDELFAKAHLIQANDSDKFVIFSDLHMGNGTSKDDFKQNSTIFSTALHSFYKEKEYRLILNGDVEELQRFSYDKIYQSWKDVYSIFDEFHAEGRLFKTIGNHDLNWSAEGAPDLRYPLHDALVLRYKDGDVFVFHGHQVGKKYQRHNRLVGYTLKYLANPLRIKNYSVSHDSRKQYQIERRVYHYSVFRKKMSIIGHTHRPLFESLSKAERIINQIDYLCREYANTVAPEASQKLIKTIESHKKELQKIIKKGRSKVQELRSSLLYNTPLHIPCLFNSGCVIGKRGMTCLEIENGHISLVHWFDKDISTKYLNKKGYEPEELDQTGYYRMVLNRETLSYIFTRIQLLT
jgi:predicted phosphodiesterase